MSTNSTLGRVDPVAGVEVAEPPITAGEVDDTVGLVAWSELDDEQAAARSVRATASMPSTARTGIGMAAWADHGARM